MANLASTDITVTFEKRQKLEDNRKINHVSLAFGDGTKTYAAGGVPVTGAQLGCPNNVDSIEVYGAGADSYNWSYDKVNKKLMALYTPVAGNQAQPSTVAIAAQVLKAIVIGY